VTPDEVAWVAEHVIFDYHLSNEANWWCGPDFNLSALCPCQMPCSWCDDGHHEHCRRATAKWNAFAAVQTAQAEAEGEHWTDYHYQPETYLRAPAPHRPPDPKRPLYVAVWLADRICRMRCVCDASGHTSEPAAAPTPSAPAAEPSPIPAPTVLPQGDQLGLFEAVSAP
jgi:hypothetical protein